MSSFRTASFDGLTFCSEQNLTGWKIELAARIYRHFEGREGSPFTADLLKIDDLFPDTSSKIVRRDRLNRLMDTPLQVQDLVFTIDVGEKAGMYMKTRRLVARVGSIGGLATSVTTAYAPPQPQPQASMPVQHTAVAARLEPVAEASTRTSANVILYSPHEIQSFVMQLQREVKALHEWTKTQFDILEVNYGRAADPGLRPVLRLKDLDSNFTDLRKATSAVNERLTYLIDECAAHNIGHVSRPNGPACYASVATPWRAAALEDIALQDAEEPDED